MPDYRFVTRWTFVAPPRTVFAFLGDVMTGDAALPGMDIAHPAHAVSAGERIEFIVRSPFGYSLPISATLTEVIALRRISADATGALRGRGVISLREHPQGGTDLRIDWEVDATLRWMRHTRVLAPVYRLAHGLVMRRAYRAMTIAMVA